MFKVFPLRALGDGVVRLSVLVPVRMGLRALHYDERSAHSVVGGMRLLCHEEHHGPVSRQSAVVVRDR